MTIDSNKNHKTTEPMITQFGRRSVSLQNYSHIFCIPSQALANLGNPKHLEVTLVMQNGLRFLKLSPVVEQNKEEVSK
jgi:hypothetical protein